MPEIRAWAQQFLQGTKVEEERSNAISDGRLSDALQFFESSLPSGYVALE